MEAPIAPSTGLKRSPAQQKLAEKAQYSMAKRNAKNNKVDKRLTGATAELPRSSSPPSPSTTAPSLSALDASTPESDLRSSQESQPSHSEGDLSQLPIETMAGHSTPPTDNAASSSSPSAESSSSSPSPRPTTMASQDTPVIEPLIYGPGEYAASDALEKRQQSHAPAGIVDPEVARKAKRAEKQRQYRRAEKDLRDNRPSLELRMEIEERAKLKRQRKQELRAKQEEERKKVAEGEVVELEIVVLD